MTASRSSGAPVISGVARSPGGPVAGARVTIESSPRPMPDIAALTDGDGRFALGTTGPGHYTIAVHADGFEVARVECDIEATDEQVELSLIRER